jgi:hypothetical protein
MNRNSRSLSLAVTLMIALGAALAAVAFSDGQTAHAHQHAKSVTAKELKLRNDMRKLWEDHVTWTRLAVISLTSGTADTNATVARLLRNQTDIGNAVKPFYGRAAGAELTRLLKEHITVAAAVITAAKAGDKPAQAAAQTRWETNADQIARFLSRANPHWKLGPMRSMLRDHLRLTTREVVARLQRNWTADVAAYDEIHRQALHMADMLSTGIVGQFPKRFR